MRRTALKLLPAWLAAGASAARAQSAPAITGPIRIVVPVTAGGPVDIVSRRFAAGLQAALGENVVVENRTGGSGVPAMLAVVRAKPDGTTLAMGTIGTMAVNPYLMKSPPYNPLRDFEPVSLVADVPGVLVVNASAPWATVADLLKYARANPGKLNFGSPGNGTSPHMAAELFKQKAGIDIVHVPYPGATQANLDLIGGQIHLYFDNILTALPNIKSGKLKPLAVSGPKRSPHLPGIPTIGESGLPGYEVTGWMGLVAPAGTPPDIVRRISDEVQKLARSEDIKAHIPGAEPIGSTPDAYAKFLRAENERWSAVIRTAGIELN